MFYNQTFFVQLMYFWHQLKKYQISLFSFVKACFNVWGQFKKKGLCWLVALFAFSFKCFVLMPRKWLLLHLFIIQNKTFPSFRRLHLKQFRFFFKTMFLSLNGLKKSFNGLTLFRVLLLGTGVENLVPHIKLFFHHLFPKQRFYCCLQQMALLRFYCIFLPRRDSNPW